MMIKVTAGKCFQDSRVCFGIYFSLTPLIQRRELNFDGVYFQCEQVEGQI